MLLLQIIHRELNTLKMLEMSGPHAQHDYCRSVETYVKMGTQLGVTSSMLARHQELPSLVLQEADTYSTAKDESFRRLAVMQMELRKAEEGVLTTRSSCSSKWDVVKATVTLRNREFLAMLLQADEDSDTGDGEQVELATQKTVVVREE
jgi:hypothetical protein